MIKTTPFEMVFIMRDHMNIPLYEDVLTYRMIFCGVAFGVCTCVFLIILLFQTKDMWSRKMRHTKQRFRISDYFCIGMIALCLFWGSKYTLECHYDIENKAYHVWVGDFTIVRDGKSWFCYIPDEDGFRLEIVDSLPEGNHTGRVVYSEKSRILLECHIDEE